MDQPNPYRNKLSTITEMTESTTRPSLDCPSETSINAMELDVTERILDRSKEIRQTVIDKVLAPKISKTMRKICLKLKIVDDEQKAKLHAIEQDVVQECHRLLQQRIDEKFTDAPDIQLMVNQIIDMTVELTDRTSVTEKHLPIRKHALEQLTNLSSTISETVKQNNISSSDLEQELKDQEQEANTKRKQLFRVSFDHMQSTG
jgi:hypothetical protein